MVVLAAKAALSKKKLSKEQLYELKSDIMKRLLQKKFPRKKIGAILEFLKAYVRLGDQELDRQFEQGIEYLTNERKSTMGMKEALLEIARLEGLEKGREEGKKQFVRYLMIELGLNDEQIAQTAEVSVPFVKSVRVSLQAGG